MAFFNFFFKFLPFRMQQTLRHTTQCNLSRFMVLFLYFVFSDIVIGHLGDQCAFGLVLVFVRLCINLPPFPSQLCKYITVSFRCSCAGPGDMAICCPMYASTPMLDALMRFRRSSIVCFCLSVGLRPIIVRYRQHGHYLRCPKRAGTDFRV